MPSLQRRYVPFILAVLSGLLLHFAMPKWNVETCLWLWIHPLLAVFWVMDLPVAPPASAGAGKFKRIWRAAAPMRRIFLLGWLAGLAFFTPTLSWVRNSPRVFAGATDGTWAGWGAELGGAGTVAAMAGFMALYFGVWAVFMVKVARPRSAVLLDGTWLQISAESLRCSALAAAFWVVMEWQRGIIITGFAWDGLGVALSHNLILVQVADIVGIAGTAFLPVLLSCVIFNTGYRLILYWREKKRFRLCLDTSVAVLVLALVAVYGIRKMGMKPETMPVRVACVQVNEPQAVYWSGAHLAEMYQRYGELTRLYGESRGEPKASPVDLVIWPEGAMELPFNHEQHPAFINELLGMGDFSLLAGCTVGDPSNKPFYNSAALFTHDWDHVQFYHKVHLVPFGEYLPFRYIPLMRMALGGVIAGDFDFGPSTEPLLLAKPQVQVIPLICFEDTVGELARQFVRDAPQFMANLTNDGWFLDSDEMDQHKAAAIFRCIELRRPMVRATNTGTTCFIDTRGVELKRLADPVTGSTLIEGVLPGVIEVPIHPEMTFFALHGDVFSWLCAGASLLAMGLAWRRTRLS
ncbi:MAG: Apolipoprotein N-acyltransferase [Verrucomicrobiaceae bacterium]|nr:Apolipoprotein N-acyltransferase [Verrucomicrobiaceae bacterium]